MKRLRRLATTVRAAAWRALPEPVQRVLLQTVWAPGALDADPKKYRSLKRVWLPVYDLFAIWSGINATIYGSLLLHRIYGDYTDGIGLVFTAVAVVCLAGVAFPRLWLMETFGKIIMFSMVVAYIGCIIFFPSPEQLLANEQPNWFIVTILAFGLPLACFRLNLISEEHFERKVQERVAEILNETGPASE